MATERYRGIDDDGRTVEIEITPLSRSEMGAVLFMALAMLATVAILGFCAGRWSRSPAAPGSGNTGSVIRAR